MSDELDNLSDAIVESFQSDYGNLVDALVDSFLPGRHDEDDSQTLVGSLLSLSNSAKQIANSITPVAASPGRDSEGNVVGCLTEAVMSVGSSLDRIASAIQSLAEAVESLK